MHNYSHLIYHFRKHEPIRNLIIIATGTLNHKHFVHVFWKPVCTSCPIMWVRKLLSFCWWNITKIIQNNKTVFSLNFYHEQYGIFMIILLVQLYRLPSRMAYYECLCEISYFKSWGFWLEKTGRNLGIYPKELSQSPWGLLEGHIPVCFWRTLAGDRLSLLPGRFTVANLNFNTSSPMSRLPWNALTRLVPSKHSDFTLMRSFFP